MNCFVWHDFELKNAYGRTDNTCEFIITTGRDCRLAERIKSQITKVGKQNKFQLRIVIANDAGPVLACFIFPWSNLINMRYVIQGCYIFSFDLEDFRYNQVNMTAFRLVDSDDSVVRKTLQKMEVISPIGKAILNQTQVICLKF